MISEKQHGFVPGKICVTNLLEILDFFTNALSDGHIVDEILLDLSKAFDLVPHRKLILKIRRYGAANELIAWLDDFSKDRRQIVV